MMIGGTGCDKKRTYNRVVATWEVKEDEVEVTGAVVVVVVEVVVEVAGDEDASVV